MSNENKKDYESLMWIGFVLLLIALIVVYLFTIGKVNLLSSKDEEKSKENEHKEKLENRIRILDHRYKKVQKVLEKKQVLKGQLDTVSRYIFLGVRLVIVFIFIAVGLVAHIYLNAGFNEIVVYIQTGLVVICFLAFVIFGNPKNIIAMWSHLTKKLTLYIYGKYINLDRQIDSHNEELKNINSEKQNTEKELTELMQVEIEIQDVIAEFNSVSRSINDL